MNEAAGIRILLVDDHPVVRRGIAQVIVEAYPLATIREACSVDDTVASVQNEDWALAILDLTLGETSGLDVLKQIKKIRPRMPVLILSVHAVEQFAKRCISAGASGYLTKAVASGELAGVITRLINGGTYFADAPIETAADPVVQQYPHERLSDREYEVLRLIGEGRTVSEIANALTLSVKTISTYRTRLMTKMGTRTNAELVHYAVRTGLSRPWSSR
jgi:DNA-binding NarL/FixJ family response regulator